MRIKCYSVRLRSLTRISGKAYKATDYTGGTCVIPSSQVIGQDYDVIKSDAWWISAWILEKIDIQYSTKKMAWFDSDTGRMLPTYVIEKHVPESISPVDANEIESLRASE